MKQKKWDADGTCRFVGINFDEADKNTDKNPVPIAIGIGIDLGAKSKMFTFFLIRFRSA